MWTRVVAKTSRIPSSFTPVLLMVRSFFLYSGIIIYFSYTILISLLNKIQISYATKSLEMIIYYMVVTLINETMYSRTRSAQTYTVHACALSFICHKRSLANYQYSMHTRLHTTYIKCVYNSLRVHEMMHMKYTTLCVVLVHKGNCKRIAYRL